MGFNSLWIIPLIIIVFRFTNSGFRYRWDSIFNQCSYYTTFNSKEINIRLPSNTAYAFRFSKTGIAYYCNNNKANVISFLKSNISNYKEEIEDNKTLLIFEEAGSLYTIEIEDINDPKGVFLTIYSNQENG